MTEWKEYKLGEIVTYQRGHDLPKDKMIDGDIPVAGSNGIIGYHNQFTKEGPGVTIGRSGNIGIPHYYPNAYWAHNTVLYIIDFKGNDTKFMYYLLKTFDFTQLNTGSAVPSLNRNHIHELPVSIPDLPTQQRIASILSSLDDKIDLLHRENKTLEAMAETLFKELVVNENNDGTLENIISIQNGYAFKSKDFKETGEHQIIKIKNISSGIIDIDSTDCVDSDVLVDVSTKFKVNSGDVLIAMTGAEIGKLGVIPKNDKSLWLNQRVGLLVEKYKGAKYLAYLQLKSEYGQDYIENTATGSAQPNISGTGIEQCGFPILDEEIIIQISKQIGEFYDKIILNLGQINVLKNTLNSMQFQLFNR